MRDLDRATILFCLMTPLCLTGVASQAQEKPIGVEVEMIQSDEVKLPAEFRVALYENLVQQLHRKGTFENVYRDGDRNAAGGPAAVSEFAKSAVCALRGVHGRSKFGGRADSMTKPEPSRRSASAPRSRQRFLPITVASQSGGSARVATMTVARRQSSSKASGAST